MAHPSRSDGWGHDDGWVRDGGSLDQLAFGRKRGWNWSGWVYSATPSFAWTFRGAYCDFDHRDSTLCYRKGWATRPGRGLLRWYESRTASSIRQGFSERRSVLENLNQDERFMRAALSEALAAQDAGEVPVGAVAVHDGRIIGRGYNQRETLNDPTAHAEMLALTAAAAFLNSWRLDRCTLYVTLEPCVMCAGAIVLARIERLVYGATDPKGGACTSLYRIPTDERLNHRVQIGEPVLSDECAMLLQAFFTEQRALGKK